MAVAGICGEASDKKQPEVSQLSSPSKEVPPVAKDEKFGVNERRTLAQIFKSWLAHSQQAKEKWREMIRFRYLLGRGKLKRVLLAWKVQVRKKKVSRLQYTIGSH